MNILREVLKSIPPSEVNPSIKDVNLDFEGLPTDRTLGVVWDLEKDFSRSYADRQLMG